MEPAPPSRIGADPDVQPEPALESTVSDDDGASPDAPPSASVPWALAPGTSIHRYIILDRVGEGGMGVVYAAYDPSLDRRIALKFLARHDADRHGVREKRLLREAQAMGRLSHPNVAVAFDVGKFQGHVFLAMEFVDGVDLRTWLAAKPRSFVQILDVFRAAGRGLAAAHAAGIIHRDFKPENVLLDGHDRPRVTDFGLSRATHDPADGEGEAPAEHGGWELSSPSHLSSPLTRTGGVLGTPSYMPPEQRAGGAVDARSDQFSFCVALHEAVYGEHPFPGTPSERAANRTVGRVAPAPAHAAVPRWCRAIIHRGLAARPEDRWPTMEALLEALSRDPAAVRRRWLVGGCAALAAAGLTLLVLTHDQPPLCRGGPARAAEVWNGSTREQVRSAFLASSSPIAADVFGRVDRLLAARLGRWTEAYTDACEATHVRGEQSEAMLDLRMQCLERARRQIGSLVDLWKRDPIDVEKAIDAAGSVGDMRACADAEALAMPLAPPRDPETVRRIDQLRARLDRVEAHERAGQLTAGLSLAREVVAAAKPLGYPPILAEALYRNGELECEAGKLEAGLPLLHAAALASADAHDDVLHARVLSHLIFQVGSKSGPLDEGSYALPFARAAVARADNREDVMADFLWGEGALLTRKGQYEEALARLREAVPLLEKRLGPDHPEVARLLHGIASNLELLGRLDEAVQIYRRVVAVRERILGPDHPDVASTISKLASVLIDQGDLEQADRYLERALAIREKVFPPGNRYIATSLNSLGALRGEQGRDDEALPLYERAEKIRSATLGPDHPETLTTRMNIALAAINLGDTAKGRRVMESVIPVVTRVWGENHNKVAYAWRNLGLAYLEEENWPKAEAAFLRALTIRRKLAGDSPQLPETLVNLGNVRIGQRRWVEAIALLEEARTRDERVRGENSLFRTYILTALGQAYLGAGRVADAVRTLEESMAIADQSAGKETFPPRAVIRFELARALWASGARRRALVLARAAHGGLTEARTRKERERIEKWLRAHRL